MRQWSYGISCLTAVWLVSTDSAVAEVVGLALLFMAAFNIGWISAEKAHGHNTQ